MIAKHTHTQGPWTYYMTISDIGCVPQVQTVPVGPVGGAYATMICTLSRTGQKSGVGEANARLIAASPDMLTALKSIRRQYPANSEAHEIADAAIAKVEGNA
jgi:hypothetical protein